MLRLSIIPLLLLSFITYGQVLAYVDSVEVHRTDTIYFDFGSAELTESAFDAVTALAQDRPDELALYLEGHTDAVGSNDANDRLAQRRSEAALAAAQAAGWPDEFIEIRHFGERRLEVDTEAREWRNRRVLLRSGKPRRYARFRGLITDQEGNPLPGAAIAQSRYLKDSVRADSEGYYEMML
ncbi:MAG: OmpA family protein, partial [Bacteroidota bacterium]